MIAGLAAIAILASVLGSLLCLLLGFTHAIVMGICAGMLLPVLIMALRIAPLIAEKPTTIVPDQS